jgi:UDP-glucose 4,6-dehydratase
MDSQQSLPKIQWSPKHVLVTGGCGFIGSNFVNYMVEKYPTIHFYNIDCLNYCASVDNITKTNQAAPNYTLIKGDITSYDLISHILTTSSIDCIIHFAAQSHVDGSFTNSFQYTRDNVQGTHVLLEASRTYGKIQRFIHVSTDEVYGESGADDISIKTEKSMLVPTNPYAATKAAAEMLVCSYYKSFRLPVIISRGNNVYGPNQYPEKLIPKFITYMKKNTPCTIHGDGQALRNFLYVSDVVHAFEKLLFQGVIGEIYNIGGNEQTEISVMDITHRLCELIKGRHLDLTKDVAFVADRHFNDQRYWISNDKLRALGWEPQIDLATGLQLTIDSFN